MTMPELIADRRRDSRLDGTGLAVTLRPRGRLGALPADAVDFNRYGIAVQTDQPLSKDRTVYLSLRCGDLRVDHLVGVVHNCVRQGVRYRSGIRFRPSSELQRDRVRVQELLSCLESSLLVGSDALGAICDRD
jgi:hypothetical protein